MNIQNLFELGMKRKIPDLLPSYNTIATVLNLGCGSNIMPHAHNLDLPAWDANKQPIPFDDESVDEIHAYHFLEHVDSPLNILKEIQRVLKVGGHCNIVVPYYKSDMSYHDITHKHHFSAEYLKVTFENPYYDNWHEKIWHLKIHANMIIGIVDRNICIMSQIVKVGA